MENRFTLVNKSCCTRFKEFTFTTDDGTIYNLSNYKGESDLYLPYRDANKFGGITRLLSDLNNGSKNPDELGWMYGRFYSHKSSLPQGRVKILPVKSIKADSGLLITRSEFIIDNSYASAAAAAPVAAAPAPTKSKKSSSYKCSDIRPERCHKYKTHCVQDSPGEFIGEEIDEKTGETLYVYKNKRGTLSSWPYSRLNPCRKIVRGPELDEEFYRLIDPQDLLVYNQAAVPDVLPAFAAIQVPSSDNLVVSDLPKSNSGVAKTEQVMEQVMAANVSKGLLSRKKSVEILASPAAQNYADIRQHLTQGEVRNLDADMLAVHSGVEEILEDRKLTGAEEKTKLEALFDKYDLCKYVRTADKVKLTVLELMAKLTSFGQVDKRFRQAKNRSTICYIILSVVLMDPKTFIEKLSGINKGAYSKKQLSH